MADPTNPGQPSDSSTERGTPVNVSQATVDKVTVTRMTVDTGDIKSLQADLLKQLCDCIKEQTVTLGGIITEAKKEIVKSVTEGGGGSGGDGGSDGGKQHDTLKDISKNIQALVAKGVGGGGEDGEISGGSAVQAKAAADKWKEVSTILEKNYPAVRDWGNLFRKGVMIEFKKNMGNLNKAVFDAAQSMTDLGSAARKAWAEAEKIFQLGQGGLVDITALYEDLGAGLTKNRDALQSTVETLVELREQNTLLIGTLGTNLTEVAETFKRNRQTIEDAFGDDFLGRIPFEEQNEVLTQILGQARRAGVKGDASTILESRSTREQLDNLKTIAFMTGKTVKEIMKLQEQTSMELDELAFNNLLTQEQATKAKLTETMLNEGGQGGISQFARSIIEAGGIEMAMKNEGFAALAGVPGNMERIQTILDGYLSGTGEGADAATVAASELESLNLSKQAMGELRKLMPELKQVGLMQGAAARRINEGGAGGFAAAEAETKKAEGTLGASIQSTYNDVKEFLKNNLGEGGALGIALIANTAAVIANTWMLFRGRGKGMALETTKQATKRVAAQNAAQRAGKQVAKKGAMRAGLATAGRAGLSALGPVAAVAGAGMLGWEIGSILSERIDAAIEKQSGVEGASLGTTDAAKAFFEAIPGLGHTEDKKVKEFADAETQRIIEFHRKKKEAAALATKKGVSPQKGIAPTTPGDVAAVAPSEVANPETAKAPIEDPIKMELIKHSVHFETMIELITQGNRVRTEMLDVIGLSMNPVPGQHSAPKQRQGASRPPDAYTPLLEDAEW